MDRTSVLFRMTNSSNQTSIHEISTCFSFDDSVVAHCVFICGEETQTILRGIKKIESISYVRLSRTDRLTVDLITTIVYSQNKLFNEMENLLMCEVKIS